MIKNLLSTMSESDLLLDMPYQEFRRVWYICIENAGLPAMEWRPYSLRRGGATEDFLYHHSFDRTADRGRWSSVKTARIYINEAMSEMSAVASTAKQLEKQAYYRKYLPFR